MNKQEPSLPSSDWSLLRRYFNRAVVGPCTRELNETKILWSSIKQTQSMLKLDYKKEIDSDLRSVRNGLPLSKSFRNVVIKPIYDIVGHISCTY